MITFEVDDLDGYWRDISARALPDRFIAKMKPPMDYAWGREIHIIDPGGVCWQSANRSNDVANRLNVGAERPTEKERGPIAHRAVPAP